MKRIELSLLPIEDLRLTAKELRARKKERLVQLAEMKVKMAWRLA